MWKYLLSGRNILHWVDWWGHTMIHAANRRGFSPDSELYFLDCKYEMMGGDEAILFSPFLSHYHILAPFILSLSLSSSSLPWPKLNSKWCVDDQQKEVAAQSVWCSHVYPWVSELISRTSARSLPATGSAAIQLKYLFRKLEHHHPSPGPSTSTLHTSPPTELSTDLREASLLGPSRCWKCLLELESIKTMC